MLVQAPLPDHRDKVAWNQMALWPSNNPYQNITYKTQLETVHCIFTDHNTICRKMTRAFRVPGAINLDEAGLEERVSCSVACIAGPAKKLGIAATALCGTCNLACNCRATAPEASPPLRTCLHRASAHGLAISSAACCAC